MKYSNLSAGAAFLVPGIFWDAPIVSASLIGTQAVAVFFAYVISRVNDTVRGEAHLALRETTQYEYMNDKAKRNYIRNYLGAHAKDYPLRTMIPVVLFGKNVRVNGRVKKFDDLGSTVLKETVVKRKRIEFVETTQYSTLALWDKARKNAIHMK
ncbi:MAG: hypothetical protein H9W81_08380 [Enterococcus sp.]|nr:hypothetical protein [Enterococcus sp.]